MSSIKNRSIGLLRNLSNIALYANTCKLTPWNPLRRSSRSCAQGSAPKSIRGRSSRPSQRASVVASPALGGRNPWRKQWTSSEPGRSQEQHWEQHQGCSRPHKSGSCQWIWAADSKTTFRPDIVMVSEAKRTLSCWSLLRRGKSEWRSSLVRDFHRQGWKARCLPVEVGHRGFVGQSVCRAYTTLVTTGEKEEGHLFSPKSQHGGSRKSL